MSEQPPADKRTGLGLAVLAALLGTALVMCCIVGYVVLKIAG